ncbi:hypothetical protein PL75_10045 [Neisseria arctica]|uniref:Uncharacterized protein n=1 Tax=Neisseria arctica TaxID=1470200 RepID=A0A0J0YPL2_9NEIS|nr:hypothetical protein [Neisseria arctica]KLT72077.1 hypothetical protein PL75_10045 [Neisseria arctica]UOO85679.1 hypothetical protein LVJ86_05405 [Neisseria arctica]
MSYLAEKINELKDEPFKAITIHNPAGADYACQAKVLYQAKATEYFDEVTLYYTQNENFVLIRNSPDWQPVITRDAPSLFGVLGYGKDAKQIYQELGIEELKYI